MAVYVVQLQLFRLLPCTISKTLLLPNAQMSSPSPLKALSDLIVSGVNTIESTYANHGATFPSLDDQYRGPPEFDDSALVDSANLVIAAAAQLIACLRPPVDTILFIAQSVKLPPLCSVLDN